MSGLILPRRLREGRQLASPRNQRGFIINPYVFGSSAPSYWAHVKAQLHFEGADGSTTITDTGPLATAFTNAGTAAIRTAGGIWGSSAYEPGSAGSANAANTNFAIGTGVPFTVRFWLRKASGVWTGAEKVVCGIWNASYPDIGWLITINASGYPTFYWCTPGNAQGFPYGAIALPNDANKVMVSVSRIGAGADLMFHVGGVYVAPTGTGPGSSAINQPASQPFRVGAYGPAGTYTGPLGASKYLDELEVIIGACLYTTSNYTPDTGPFPTY